MTDDSGEIHTGDTVKIERDKEWFQRPAGLVFLVALSLSLLIFAVSSVIDRVSYRNQNDDLRHTAAELLARNDQLTKDNAELNIEQECRSQRAADLAVASSDVTGTQAKLVVLLLQGVRDPTVYQPVLDELSGQTERREAAAARYASAVKDCQVR